jgi:hypothetical protein
MVASLEDIQGIFWTYSFDLWKRVRFLLVFGEVLIRTNRPINGTDGIVVIRLSGGSDDNVVERG